ncbi:MAG: thioredoxin fold domain-containing protein [Gracilimonas sp.]|nr:thioredoxin fold domain-containing protein [Gracilimonas sp.]
MKTKTGWFAQLSLFTILMVQIVFVPEMNAQAPGDSGVAWVSYTEATENAESDQKTLMLFLEAEWCTVCKRMHREVFTDESVIEALNTHFYPVRLDIESNDKIQVKGKKISIKEFSKKIGVYGTPTILFLDEEEDIIGNFVGYSDEKDLLKLLNYIESEAYLSESMEGFSYQ